MNTAAKFLILLVVVLFSADNVITKVYDPCDLAKEMVEKHRFTKTDIADWICLIRWESNFNTSEIGRLNADSSMDHGLFQISDKYWCVEGQVDGACGIDCKALRDDDIKDDSICVRRIFRLTKQRTGNGFDAWAAWKQRCQNQNVQSYIAHCK
ncbi:lysozyme C-1 [Folsomia candida]|uniref:lysozyme n=1 Tax=Folsomia candida TaxID=158441 RepID=A0A226F1D3_FOLCA|nr:lysozyme C-1 [Folsomia candida]OXA63234.1 Lysozyme C [Folsomia candida]